MKTSNLSGNSVLRVLQFVTGKEADQSVKCKDLLCDMSDNLNYIKKQNVLTTVMDVCFFYYVFFNVDLMKVQKHIACFWFIS